METVNISMQLMLALDALESTLMTSYILIGSGDVETTKTPQR